MDENGQIAKKATKMRDQQLKKEMKSLKMSELKKIESMMNEHNEKVLM